MQLVLGSPKSDFIFGVGSNAILSRLAAPLLEQAKRLHEISCQNAKLAGCLPPAPTCLYGEGTYAASTWPQPFRVIIKVEASVSGVDTRFVVTTFNKPTPKNIYEKLYCVRGQDENYIKMIKNDLHGDRTSDHTFLANHMRLYFSCAAYVLLHALRTQTLANTELSNAQPLTIILKLFKIAVRVVQYKDRIKLHLPTSCPVKHIIKRVTDILFQVPVPIKSTA